MANELTINLKVGYESGNTSDLFELALNLAVSQSTANSYMRRTQVIGASEEALVLGDFTSGFIAAVNRDATQRITIRDSTGGKNMIDMGPGEPCLFRIHGDSGAPFVIADGGTPTLEYVIVGN